MPKTAKNEVLEQPGELLMILGSSAQYAILITRESTEQKLGVPTVDKVATENFCLNEHLP